MLVMTQSDEFHNPLIFCNLSLAQQVFIAVIDNGGGSDSEKKDKLDTFKFFRKFLVVGFTRLQWGHAWVLTSGTRSLKHVSRNNDQYLEHRLPLEHI